MDRPIGRVLVGDDHALTAKTIAIALALGCVAVGTVVGPRYWIESGVVGSTPRLIAGVAVILSAGGAARIFAAAGGLPPRPPALGVALVIVALWGVGWGLNVRVLFSVGPILSLGALAALAAYANNGALAALSLVFVPVFAYLLLTPTALPTSVTGVLRVRLSILLGLLFALGIGSAGFLLGAWFRWAEAYAELQREFRLDPFDRME